MDAKLRLDHSLVAIEADGVVHGLLELRAPVAEVDADSPSLAIALVIDRSGSMGGEKLEVAKACGRFLADRLAPEDRMAVISYDDTVSLEVGPQGSGPAISAALGHIHPGGSTNLSGGWLKGVEVLEGVTADIRRVVLLTDGLANVGITDRDQLASISAAAAGRGISTTAIGFGADFDEDLLAAMADAGRGHDYFASSPEEAPSIFAEEFTGLAKLTVQNLSIEIRPKLAAMTLALLNEYPLSLMGDGIQATIGDLFGGEERKLVFKLQIPGLADLGNMTVAEAVVRWADISAGTVELHTRTIPIAVNVVSAATASSEAVDSEVTEEVVVLEAAKARAEARRLADRGDLEEAHQLLAEQSEKLKGIPRTSRLFQMASDDVEELERFSLRLESRVYDRTDSKALLEQSRRRSRSQSYRQRGERKS